MDTVGYIINQSLESSLVIFLIRFLLVGQQAILGQHAADKRIASSIGVNYFVLVDLREWNRKGVQFISVTQADDHLGCRIGQDYDPLSALGFAMLLELRDRSGNML